MKFDSLVNAYLTENNSDLLAIRERTKQEDLGKLEASERLKKSGLKYINFPTTNTPNVLCKNFKGDLSIIRDSERDIVLIDLGTIKIPFYKSTGEGGKERVAKDKWYPFFGVEQGWGWINKLTQTQIANYYGSQILRTTSEKLDQVLGSGVCGWGYKCWGAQNAEEIYKVLNQDLVPSSSTDIAGYSNAANVISKVNGSIVLKITGSTGSMDLRIPTEINPSVIKRVVSDDAKFFSDPQFTFFKPEKYFGIVWAVKPNPNAKNQTHLNGQPLQTPMTIKYGSYIEVGNTGRVGKITIDV